MLTKYIKELDLEQIIDNNHDSMDNLIAHKHLINSLIGHLNQMKELCTYAVKERDENASFVEQVFYNWGVLKNDSELVAKIKKVNVEPILKKEAKSI